MRLVVAASACLVVAACGGDRVWDCDPGGGVPDPGQTDPDLACQRSWGCKQANAGVLSLQVRCTKHGDGLACTCLGNGVARGRFEADATLCDGSELDVAARVNDGCRWSVPTER